MQVLKFLNSERTFRLSVDLEEETHDFVDDIREINVGVQAAMRSISGNSSWFWSFGRNGDRKKASHSDRKTDVGSGNGFGFVFGEDLGERVVGCGE